MFIAQLTKRKKITRQKFLVHEFIWTNITIFVVFIITTLRFLHFPIVFRQRELFPHVINVCPPPPAKMLTQIDDSMNQLGTSWAPKTTREHNNRIRLKNKNSKIRNISSSKRINCDTVLKNRLFFFYFDLKPKLFEKKSKQVKLLYLKTVALIIYLKVLLLEKPR